MIDSHVHLNHQDFKGDFDEVLARAREAGVTHMVNIGFDLDSSLETLALVEKYPFIYGAVGVHPHDAKTYNDDVEARLTELLQHERIVAVGEIGLDYYRDLSPRDAQREAFVRQIDLANRTSMPIIIHCRDAFDDVIAVLRENPPANRGIFHAFGGDEAQAQTILDLGFRIGIGGVVTFKKSNLGEVVAGLPIDAIVLETDCPYLTPAPYRGKRNEPAYVSHVANKVAEVTSLSVDEVVAATNRNFAEALRLPAPA